MFWGRVEVLKAIRDAGFVQEDFAPENGAIDGNLEHAFERIFGSLCHQLGYRIHPLKSGSQTKKTVKPICFFLPQYHAIPENDEWWGKGFTEWTQIKKAKELYSGHQVKRPHDDLGYYHLLDKKVRQQQGELARQYGVYGFCYHHYWFRGKLLLEKPLQLLLEDGYPDLPFCFNWANEPWTKRWDGLESEVLQAQDYGDEQDWKDHFEYLLPFFRHHHYIRVEGKPVFCLYRIGHIERVAEMIAYWRELAQSHGLPGLHIVQVLGSFADSQIDEKYLGVVDAVCEFQPNYSNYLGAKVESVDGINTVDLQHSWDQIAQQEKDFPVYYHGGFPGWDNSPRRAREGYVFQGGSMEEFELFLKRQFVKVMKDSDTGGEPFFFLNAWNEWGEGCVMEPDKEQGYAALEALKNALAFCKYC